MITEKDLQEAIAECQAVRNPNANTCLKLAAYYTIQDKMFGESPQYSFSGSGSQSVRTIDKISYVSDTEFSQAISGRSQNEIWEIMDELMTVLEATNKRLYDGVMRKIES